MKQYLTATAALLAISAQAQLSGPNRPGPGTSPGTFQTPGATDSSIQTTSPSTSSTITPTTPDTSNIRVGPPVVNPQPGTVPRTSLGTPDATGGAASDSLRSRSTFPTSRDWETGAVGGSGANQSETRRLTPIPDRTLPDITPNQPKINPDLPTINGAGSTVSGAAGSGFSSTTVQPALRSDLNTSGVNTPARVNEQPLDKALSAKIRAELSQTPPKGMARLAPETVRDLRITSDGGKVILEGNVNTMAERQLMEAQARRVPGVVAIENRVKVSNRGVGAPAAGQIGQSRQNSSDLNDDSSTAAPGLK
ncbi:MAG TPA: BON domain-containing protein [Verrucomicrobiae bacterium]